MKLATFFIRLAGCLILCCGTDQVFAQTNFWQRTNGPEGGNVFAVAVNEAGHIFIGTNGGLFRSTNNGETWTLTSLTNSGVTTIFISSEGYILAGADGKGLFRSMDNGESWRPINNGLTSFGISDIAMNSAGDFFAGTNSGVCFGGNCSFGMFRSTDNGQSWKKFNTGLTDPVIHAVVISPITQDIFVGVNDGVYRGVNNGESWEITGLDSVFVPEIAVNSAGHLFAITNKIGVFRSTDNGETWSQLTKDLPNRRLSVLALNHDGHIFTGETFSGLFRSSDNGESWSPIGLANRAVDALGFNQGGHLFAGMEREDGMLRSTDDGKTWQPINTGLIAVFVNALAISSKISGSVFAGTSSNGVARSINNGENWSETNNGLVLQNSHVYSMAAHKNGDIFVGGVDNISYSTNNGESWSRTGFRDGFAQALAINNSNGHIFAGSNSAVHRSENNGQTWKRINLPSGSSFTSVSSLVIHPNGQVFAGTARDGVFRSSDNGDTWTQINNGLTNKEINALLVINNGHILAGPRFGGVFRSMDGGENWSVSGLPGTNILALAINSQGSIFAGTSDKGVFRSADNGKTWSESNAGLLHTIVSDLAIDNTGYIFAATLGGSVYRSVKTTIIAQSPSAPTLALPLDGVVNQPTNLILSWNLSPGADTHRLQVATSADFTTTIFDDSTLTTVSQRIGPLATNTTHYWRVRAKNIAGNSAWSSVRRFTTAVPPPAIPTLAAPANGAVNQPISITLSWNSATNTETYRLQISTSLNFSTTVVDDSTLATTSRQVGPLANNVTYYWRVRAKNAGGTSGYSAIRRFTTIIALPGQVVLLSPTPAAVLPSGNVKFTWRPSQPAINRYWFEIAADSSMANSVIDSTLKAADTTKVVLQLLDKKTYWWRVRAGNVAGWGPFSEQRRFQIDVPVSVEETQEIPTDFNLGQNHPNPFSANGTFGNPSTTIKYDLPKQVEVKLEIFDLMGRRVRTLVNQRQQAGGYVITWDGRNEQGQQVASGTFIYQLRAGTFTQRRRMALVR